MKKAYFLSLFLFIVSIAVAQEKTELKWWNPADSEFPVVAGQAWTGETNSIYHRLPKRMESKVRKPVWGLSKHSAGLSIRFWSNAPNIHIKYKVKGNVSMPHMPATGVSGVDLYSKNEHGEWLRSWGSYNINKESSYKFTIDEKSEAYKKYGREYQLFLPLYNEVEVLEIGVSSNSFVKPMPIRNEKPIVAYGTSICQGACASRPGMAWTSILERKLERPFINLGFSGNGRLEPEIIDLLTEIDAKLYILDCLPNLSPQRDNTHQLVVNAVKQIRVKRPKTPIILTEHIGYANEFTNKVSQVKYQTLNNAMQSAFEELKSDGYTNIFVLSKNDMNLQPDSYVDYIHPSDLGMMEYADAYESLIRKITNEPKGSVSTTIPKTQRRDIAVCEWEERHQEILEANKTNPPEICFLGNSIVHFWGGEPKTRVVNGKNSWDKILKPLGVRNFGFGWDRLENMIWRVHHDEFDGFEAKQILIMAGTNNLHLNSEDEIVAGLEALVEAIRIRQPKSKIVLIGILPRKESEEKVNNLNRKISQLANLENVAYKNIGNVLLLQDGKIDDTMFTDGLHPNKKGYALLATKIKAIVKE